MTKPVVASSWKPSEDYDDHARWLDDEDGGDRWRAWAACRDQDPELFFPLVVERVRVPIPTTEFNDVSDGWTFIEIQTDEEPPYPPPAVKAICERCPVRGRCLKRYMDEPVGIFGGTTGFQRELMTKKIVRKVCMSCGSTDLVLNNSQKKEVCLACGVSWDIL